MTTPTRLFISESAHKTVYETASGQRIQCFHHHPSETHTSYGRGALNNQISDFFMRGLTTIGVPHHLKRVLNMHEQLVTPTQALPFFVHIYGACDLELSHRFGLKPYTVLKSPILEYRYASAQREYPMLTTDHILAFEWADMDDIEDIQELALKTFHFIAGMFWATGFKLLKARLGFGCLSEESSVLLIDDITPDTFDVIPSSAKTQASIDEWRRNDVHQQVAKALKIIH